METVLITGGSGLIGQRLTPMLLEKGYNVTHLSRKPGMQGKVKIYGWDVEKGEIDKEAVITADHIIHLAGANIGEGRWTTKRKHEIISSRRDSAKLIYQCLHKSNTKLKTFITGSGVGYYGAITTDKIFTEQDAPAKDFLGEVCRLWEEAAGPIAAMKIRTVRLRFGVVLSMKGGALKAMAGPVKNYFGSALGSGKQWVPWLHIDDACRILIHALENQNMQGAYNAACSQHITNKELTKWIAKALNKPLILPNAPSFVLKLMMGEMACIALEGSRVSNDKLLGAGFSFSHPHLDEAIKDLVR